MGSNQATISFLTNLARAALGVGTSDTILNSSLYTVDSSQLCSIVSEESLTIRSTKLLDLDNHYKIDMNAARVIVDRETGRSRGFGFVTFADTEAASAAIQAMDQRECALPRSEMF
ncbi:hypothetical protein SSX86_010679 [Deinandra increscens subsp. villosa]|uniref:RRM domain-containing protein n=1 Tax=Deinandra increscens subsp. villosa TaxID=3103831 RepID=A0AAP0D8F1_9ASTR